MKTPSRWFFLFGVLLVTTLSSWIANLGHAAVAPAYANPGWDYLYDGAPTQALGTAKAPFALDGTWSANNGSSEWDGSWRGAGNGQPGGISSDGDILTIEDIDLGSGSLNNRKIYFEHTVAYEPWVTNRPALVDNGVTLSFRARLTQPGILPAAELPNGLPDGWGIFSDGKGMFNVHARRDSGTRCQIGFSLVRANEPVNNFNFTSPGLTFNRLNGDSPAGSSAVNSTGTASQNPILPLDPNVFHEFWITIRENDSTAGNGTHVVEIYLDGATTPAVFNVTAGTGNDGETGTNGTFIAMGLNNSVGSSCMDVDFFAYKQGIHEPVPFLNTNAPPQVRNLVPARGAIFVPSETVVSFDVTTVEPNAVAPEAIQLSLNGQDVTGDLVITGDATNRSVTYTGLSPNVLYTATVIASDSEGRVSTNSWSFDTFATDGSVTIIEAEDYNFGDGDCFDPANPIDASSGGQFIDMPLPGDYAQMVGLPGADYFDTATTRGSAVNNAFRQCDYVGTQKTSDILRPAFAVATNDYQIAQVQTGEWLNYTRNFSANYEVYLRVAASAPRQLQLGRVSGDPTSTAQTNTPLGSFNVPNTGAAFSYVPLTDVSGSNAVVNLSGAQTVRLMAISAANDVLINYLLFVPVSASRPPSVSAVSPINGSTGVPVDRVVSATILNGDTTVADGSVRLEVNGQDVTSQATIDASAEQVVVTYDPAGFLPFNSTFNVKLVFQDTAAVGFTNEWSFTTMAAVTIVPGTFATPIDSGGDRGFNLKMRKAPNTLPSSLFPHTIHRAELQLADQLSNQGQPIPNEAPGPGGQGLFLETDVINYEQMAGSAGAFTASNGRADEAFPGIDPAGYTAPEGPNYIVLEAVAYLELTAGLHRFGVRSDDNFRLTVGPVPTDTNLVLGSFEGLTGRADAPTEFSFLVESNGLYAFRLIFEEGTGGASLEFYSIDPATDLRTLINDPLVPEAVKAFSTRTGLPLAAPPQLGNFNPADGTLFHSAAAGLSFDAVVNAGHSIDPTNIQVVLNGTDISSALSITGTAESRGVSFTGLEPNRAYVAVITVADESANVASATLRFDTFNSDEGLFIEAEDYNYGDGVCGVSPSGSGGLYTDNPAPGDSAGKVGLSLVDYFDRQAAPDAGNVYRACDTVGTLVSADATRLPFVNAGVADHDVWRWQPGEWMQYTRTFSDSAYAVYLRASAASARELRLGLVVGDATMPDQPDFNLGAFRVPVTAGPAGYQYVPLTDVFGNPRTIRLNGAQTLRLSSIDANLSDGVKANFLLLVPVTEGTPPALVDISPAPDASRVGPESLIEFTIANGATAVDFDTFSLHLNGEDVTAQSSVAAVVGAGAMVTLTPLVFLPADSTQTVTVAFNDTGSPAATVSNSWSFTTRASSAVPLPSVNVNFQAPTTTDTPVGYLPDTGLIFGDRGNGYSYGWDADNTANARDRNSANSPDNRYDTLNHINKDANRARVWEIALPNGDYGVYAVAGDPDNSDSTFAIMIEGVLVVSGAASDANRFFSGSNVVSVSDGRLTLTSQLLTGNNKICFIEITPFSPVFAPVISQQPVSQTAAPGSAVNFDVFVRGTDPLAYQWYFGDTPLEGATTRILTLNDVGSTNAGGYSVVVTNAAGAVTSSIVTLNIHSGPQITSQPQTVTVEPGQDATFTVVATGAEPLAYQWEKDGAQVEGANAASLTLTNVQLADAGVYIVVVSDSEGATPSQPASLRVLVRPTPSHFVANLSQTSFGFSIDTVVGLEYVIEYKNAIDDLTWTELTTIAGDGSVRPIVDNTASGNSRFYRIRVQ